MRLTRARDDFDELDFAIIETAGYRFLLSRYIHNPEPGTTLASFDAGDPVRQAAALATSLDLGNEISEFWDGSGWQTGPPRPPLAAPLPLFAPALHDALMSDEQQPDPDGCPSRLVPHLCPNSPDACGCGRHTVDSATASSQVRPGFLDKRGVQWTLSIALLTGRFGVQVPGGAPTRTGP
jgi:hypothetical protein